MIHYKVGRELPSLCKFLNRKMTFHYVHRSRWKILLLCIAPSGHNDRQHFGVNPVCDLFAVNSRDSAGRASRRGIEIAPAR
jgi:hypothetical protein